MQELKLISSTNLLALQEKPCWSIESRKAYGAEDSQLEYIGSKISGTSADGSAKVVDYYKDEQGRFWYENRIRLHNGEIVTMEVYLFGNKKRPRR